LRVPALVCQWGHVPAYGCRADPRVSNPATMPVFNDGAARCARLPPSKGAKPATRGRKVSIKDRPLGRTVSPISCRAACIRHAAESALTSDGRQQVARIRAEEIAFIKHNTQDSPCRCGFALSLHLRSERVRRLGADVFGAAQIGLENRLSPSIVPLHPRAPFGRLQLQEQPAIGAGYPPLEPRCWRPMNTLLRPIFPHRQIGFLALTPLTATLRLGAGGVHL